MTAPSSPRFLGLDFGDNTVGIAVSCPRALVATGVETLRRENPLAMKATLARLRELVKFYAITDIVLGNPLHMDGRHSNRSMITADFAARLKRNFKRLTITLWDERFSTQAVARTMHKKNLSLHVDEMAAIYILQGYLDARLSKNVQKEIDMDEQIVLLDEEGNEQPFDIIAAKDHEGTAYLLAMEAVENEEDEAEIVHFKCIATEGDDMVFEIVDEDDADFGIVMDLFAPLYEEMGITLDEEN